MSEHTFGITVFGITLKLHVFLMDRTGHSPVSNRGAYSGLVCCWRGCWTTSIHPKYFWVAFLNPVNEHSQYFPWPNFTVIYTFLLCQAAKIGRSDVLYYNPTTYVWQFWIMNSNSWNSRKWTCKLIVDQRFPVDAEVRPESVFWRQGLPLKPSRNRSYQQSDTTVISHFIWSVSTPLGHECV